MDAYLRALGKEAWYSLVVVRRSFGLKRASWSVHGWQFPRGTLLLSLVSLVSAQILHIFTYALSLQSALFCLFRGIHRRTKRYQQYSLAAFVFLSVSGKWCDCAGAPLVAAFCAILYSRYAANNNDESWSWSFARHADCFIIKPSLISLIRLGPPFSAKSSW